MRPGPEVLLKSPFPMANSRHLPASLAHAKPVSHALPSPPAAAQPITGAGLPFFPSAAALSLAAGTRGTEQVPGTAQQATNSTGADSQEAMQAVVDALSVCSVQPADPPSGTMIVTLLKHQRLALGWMLSREGAGAGKKALCPDGGILADDQVSPAQMLHRRSCHTRQVLKRTFPQPKQSSRLPHRTILYHLVSHQ